MMIDMNETIDRPPSCLVIGGERYPVPFDVVTWEDPRGLSFYGTGRPRYSRRSGPAAVDLLVFHWDGVHSSHQCHAVLLERGLSVHLMLDADGTVYQALDLALASAWHAGPANSRSVGVEVCNPVRLHRQQWEKVKRPVVTEPAAHTGKPATRLDFHDVQKARAGELALAICSLLPVPLAMPLGASGQVAQGLAPKGFKGVVGHYHLTTNKPDPGMSLWPHVAAAIL
jgi:N-acetyl-anhydromuramyl-L-alanine amidase AmpD